MFPSSSVSEDDKTVETGGYEKHPEQASNPTVSAGGSKHAWANPRGFAAHPEAARNFVSQRVYSTIRDP